MFQLLITANLKSSVGAGVAISQAVVQFETKELADEAADKLIDNAHSRFAKPAYSARTVEKLYK